METQAVERLDTRDLGKGYRNTVIQHMTSDQQSCILLSNQHQIPAKCSPWFTNTVPYLMNLPQSMDIHDKVGSGPGIRMIRYYNVPASERHLTYGRPCCGVSIPWRCSYGKSVAVEGREPFQR